jgi:predicted MPP superfamily phosphohydrolase
MGYKLLLDEHVRIQKGNESIVLAGVENWGKGFGERGDLQKALHSTNNKDFKVLLSHDPTHWDEQVKGNQNPVHLTLSGHTHGMQMGVEIPGFRWSPVKFRYKNWAGLATHEDRHLYVNRGYGFIGFTGRVGIWPEITVLTLRKA